MIDDVPPNITCPPAVTVNCRQDVPPPDFAGGAADDDPYCGGSVGVTWVGDTDNGGLGCESSPLVITRTYTAYDRCNNSASCIQAITVIDREKPVAIGLPITRPVGPDCEYCLTADDIREIGRNSFDRCGLPVTSCAPGGVPGGVGNTVCLYIVPNCFGIGDTEATLTAVDACGNVSDPVKVVITVTDRIVLTVRDGYTLQYPVGNPPNGSAFQPFLLAGPGNWVTVDVDVCNCDNLTELVFEIKFPEDYVEYTGCFEWNYNKVNLAASMWVEAGVSEEWDPVMGYVGRLIVHIDSPGAEPAVWASGQPCLAAAERVVSLIFRVQEGVLTGFDEFALTPTVIYSTGMNGYETANIAIPGSIYADLCYWLWDIDRNGRVEGDTDGLWFYRGLKYGHLLDSEGWPIVPIITWEHRDSLCPWLVDDKTALANVMGLLTGFGCDFDGLPSDVGFDIGAPFNVKSSFEGTYAFRNLVLFWQYVYPVFNPPAAYSPFVNPQTPWQAGPVTVPAAHTDRVALENAINAEIDLLKVLWCPWFGQQSLPLSPVPLIPCDWFDGDAEDMFWVPLPQPAGIPCEP